MKTNIFILIVLGSGLLFTAACKKNTADIPEPLPASVNVINATLNNTGLKVNRFGSEGSYAGLLDSVSSRFNKIYPVASGPQPFSVVVAGDTLQSIVKGTSNFAANGIYSLYVAAASPTYDTLLIKETAIPVYQDSAVGIRFINMATGAPAISITQPAAAVNEFSNLAYRMQSNFKKYALPGNPDYNAITFEARDAATGSLLATYTLPQYANYPGIVSINQARFKAVTLVFTGEAGNSSYTLFAVNNY